MKEFQRNRPWLKSVKNLLKIVATTSGDSFCFRAGRLFVGAESFGVSRFDYEGENLPVQKGCGTLGAKELLLVGGTDDSFDSRYFGPIRLEQLESKVVPLIIL